MSFKLKQLSSQQYDLLPQPIQEEITQLKTETENFSDFYFEIEKENHPYRANRLIW